MTLAGARSKRATIKDVAQVAGVSFKTVSRVINHDQTVNAHNRDSVLKAIKQLNYRVDTSARNLRSGSSHTLGLIYDRLNALYIVNIQNGAIRVCNERGYSLQILPLRDDITLDPAALAAHMGSAHLSGLIVTPPFSEMTNLVRDLRQRGVPLVRIISGSTDEPSPLTSAVQINDMVVGRELTRYLIDLGHRRIGFLWGQESHLTSIDRYRGYAAELEASGIAFRADYARKGEYTFASGFERTMALLALPERPTAIVASSDEIAAGAIVAATKSGVRVPEQLSVVGVRSSPLAHESWPSLTGFDLNAEELAAQATDLLISQLAARSATTKIVNFGLQFFERGSSARLSS